MIINGAGGKAFCSGIDLVGVLNLSHSEFLFDNTVPSLIMDKISQYKKPYVALIDGITFGGAAFFSQTSKYRVATERTSFAMPEALIGFYCNAGASFFLSRLLHNLGFYIALTCARVNGYDVKKYGLASHFVQSDQLEELIRKLGETKSESDVKSVIESFSTSKDTTSALDELIPLIDKCFNGESVEEIYANLELDGGEEAKKIIQKMNGMSPTSLKMCHRVLTLGKNLSLRECLQLEHILTTNIFTKFPADFQEGVRALLIEKDKNPKWNPRFLKDVKNEDIDKLFEAIPNEFLVAFENYQAKL